MAPVFEWDLKVLPHAIIWFDYFTKRWKESFLGAHGEEGGGLMDGLNVRKLCVLYQFVRAMPLMCVPTRGSIGVKRKLAQTE